MEVNLEDVNVQALYFWNLRVHQHKRDTPSVSRPLCPKEGRCVAENDSNLRNHEKETSTCKEVTFFVILLIALIDR